MVQTQVQTRSDSRTDRCPTLVLGVGNILLRDEGIGVRVVEAMAREGAPDGVELFDGATAGLDLLDALAGRRKVIVIDALDADCEPGTVLRLEPEELAPHPAQSVSVHDIGLMETLVVARQLGIAPESVVILGVRPAEVDCGLELSPQIAALVPRIVELVRAELESD